MHCPRSISFTLPSAGTSGGVSITATELDGGRLQFDLSLPGGGGDLRGLFLDLANPAKLAGLAAAGAQISAFDTVDVINLGGGVNMNGAAAPFDVGMAFAAGKSPITQTSFVLSNAAGNLSLDDLTHMDLGVRLAGGGGKLVASMPAAPDARDDALQMFEDGAAGLHDGAAAPQGRIFQLTANDTDADGQALTITHVNGAQHGTVTIVDGNDADTLVGDAVLYVAHEDYAGSDSFEYCISDGHGGVDSAQATVQIEAVADLPTLDVQVLAGAAAHEIRFRVSAAHTDADGSEFIDRIVAGAVPAGASLVAAAAQPGATPGSLVQEFLLTLPADASSNFDLSFSAIAKEQSNGDEQVASHSVAIDVDHLARSYQQAFAAQDQDLWGSGDAFAIHTDDFWGVDEQVGVSGAEDGFWYDISAGATFGLQQRIDIEGGEIDASISYDIDIATLHNRNTDQLTISSDALASAANFQAQGPEGAYQLDLLYDFFFNVGAGVDIGLGQWNLLPGLNGGIDLSTNLVDFDSQEIGGSYNPMPGLDLQYGWPHLAYGGGFGGSANSTDIFAFQADVDEMLAGHAPNLFDISADIGVAWGTFELLDFDIAGQLSLMQSLQMDSQALMAKLLFEDGSSRLLKMGESLTLDGASAIDAAGDGDGTVEFALELMPEVQLSNRTELVFDMAYSLQLLKFSGGYNVGVDSGELHYGPMVHLADQFFESSSVMFDDSFALQFQGQQLEFQG